MHGSKFNKNNGQWFSRGTSRAGMSDEKAFRKTDAADRKRRHSQEVKKLQQFSRERKQSTPESKVKQLVQQRLKEAAGDSGPISIFQVWLDRGGDLWNPIFSEMFALAIETAVPELDYDVLLELGEIISDEWHGFNTEDLQAWIAFLQSNPHLASSQAQEIFNLYEKTKRSKFKPQILPKPGEENE